ncbi:two component transcriptional regulator, winged helix family [Tenacibaculum maritimum]|uniref:response regulator transcription factor n=1 Tax=Tenacibaculum maritimum TaxID=107401 RepID=UPI0012E506BC|nr:response regulator transcription factor [Tenacibaculum maritimum]CAA0221693.1 two component transcriptional regulator, winged helix family [Tenacibaculum maritimum]
MKKKVLIIEDDKEIVKLLEIHLKDLEFEICKAYNGKAGLELVFSEKPDLVVLDITMPIMDGVEVCQKIRAKLNTPIIMLSARVEEIDRVLGLEIGADDYITKPFSIREFISRVKAILRRVKMNNDGEQKDKKELLEFQGLSIDLNKRKVLVDGENVDLSPKEFDLLSLMASNPGKNYNRANLLKIIWGYDFEGYEHTVNSHINRLRGKIETDTTKPKYIITRWGVGYKFNEEI